MAQFQVLGSAASPFVRKVLVMVKEAGMTDVVFETVKASPMGGDAHLNAANPSGRIPVLLREGDSPIFDSRVITRFLDQHAQAGLYPESRLWEVLTTEAAADGMIEAVVGDLTPGDMKRMNYTEKDKHTLGFSIIALPFSEL